MIMPFQILIGRTGHAQAESGCDRPIHRVGKQRVQCFILQIRFIADRFRLPWIFADPGGENLRVINCIVDKRHRAVLRDVAVPVITDHIITTQKVILRIAVFEVLAIHAVDGENRADLVPVLARERRLRDKRFAVLIIGIACDGFIRAVLLADIPVFEQLHRPGLAADRKGCVAVGEHLPEIGFPAPQLFEGARISARYIEDLPRARVVAQPRIIRAALAPIERRAALAVAEILENIAVPHLYAAGRYAERDRIFQLLVTCLEKQTDIFHRLAVGEFQNSLRGGGVVFVPHPRGDVQHACLFKCLFPCERVRLILGQICLPLPSAPKDGRTSIPIRIRAAVLILIERMLPVRLHALILAEKPRIDAAIVCCRINGYSIRIPCGYCADGADRKEKRQQH